MEGKPESLTKKAKQRCSNIYVPPPARKPSGQKQGAFERTSNSRASNYDETKACNDSSLLFLNDEGRSYSLKTNRRQKYIKKHDKNNSEKLNKPQTELNENNSSIPPKENESITITEVLTSIKENISGKIVEDEILNQSVSPESSYESDGENVKTESSNYSDNDISLILTVDNTTTDNEINQNDVSSCENCKLSSELIDKCIVSSDSSQNTDNYLEDDLKNDITVIIDNSNIIEDSMCIKNGENQNLKVDDNDWDVLYDESGECLAGDKLQVSNRTKEKKLGSLDKDEAVEKDGTENRSSIIELYGFSRDLKTKDIITIFSGYTSRGFKLKWVDDTHALGIFPTPTLANEVLACDLPMIRTRSLSQATTASQEKARNLILPSTLRPKTCSAMARRLVSGALGLKMSVTPEARAAEKEILRLAREEKKLAAKQRDNAWDGIFDSASCMSDARRSQQTKTHTQEDISNNENGN